VNRRRLTGPDRLINELDRALRALTGAQRAARETPGQDLPDVELADAQRRHAAALMRVNHAGEVCAQALYSAQALTARREDTRAVLEQAAAEEADHLAWTAARIDELGGRPSVLDPVFYAGAFGIGLVAGAAGERWNMGFLAETERQVEAHLDGHLSALPEQDHKSRAVVSQMKQDESAHAATATAHGAAELPFVVKGIMKLAARVMTATTYRI
jgi:ubiquinone biosynthesis monooxygenase Coq7